MPVESNTDLGPFCATFVFLLATAACGLAQVAQAQGNLPNTAGVRHVLKASLAIDARSPHANVDGGLDADLRASIRISDHSPEADFFGTVVVDFSGRDLISPPPARTIWEAARCHRNRGLPKITVTGIEGKISTGSETSQIKAVSRRIGKRMPDDEIIVTSRVLKAGADRMSEIGIRAETKATRLVLDLRLTSLPCTLEL